MGVLSGEMGLMMRRRVAEAVVIDRRWNESVVDEVLTGIGEKRVAIHMGVDESVLDALFVCQLMKNLMTEQSAHLGQT